MKTKEYVHQLWQLNTEIIKGKQNKSFYATCSLGLVEELLELYFAQGSNSDAEVKELGDTFAYATLLMLSAELEREIHMLSYDTIDSICTAVADDLERAIETRVEEPLVNLALFASGSFKRCFRGERGLSCYSIAHVAASALANFSYSASDVFDVNISKLASRKQRGLLDKGKGDNR